MFLSMLQIIMSGKDYIIIYNALAGMFVDITVIISLEKLFLLKHIGKVKKEIG